MGSRAWRQVKRHIKGLDAAFKQPEERFLSQLEDHLKISMTKLYTPEQIMRREGEIECQLSQNMADPVRRKSLESMMRFMASAGVRVTSETLPEEGEALPYDL